MTDTNQLWNKDRPMLIERLGRLLGSTTYRDQDSGGGVPFSTRKLTSEAEMILALKMGQTYPGDVGPWIVYSIALGIDDRQAAIVGWLARKLEKGTDAVGRRNARRMMTIALAAYRLAVHGIEPTLAKDRPNEFLLLTNIGAGWIWVKCESAVDRAQYAISARYNEEVRATA